jgi:prophage regulatory protein
METHTKVATNNVRQAESTSKTEDALWNVKIVMTRVGLGRSTIHNKVKDGTFPAPIRLSARCVRWHSKAIQQWIDALAAQAQ